MSSIFEQVKINGLELNTAPGGGNYSLESFDPGTPVKKPEWAQAADADGADLVRTPLFENRTVTLKVRVEHQASMNQALEKLGAVVDQLQEAEKNPGGIPVVWTPANSTKSITFYALTGSVTGLPIMVEGGDAGWFVNSPVVTFTLTCKPFGYGEEVAGGVVTLTAGQPNLTLTVANVPGDVPAEGRLVVTDTAGVGRRYVEWGLENRYYNAATSLLLDSEDMVPVGGAQSTALNASGAYRRAGATNGTIATTLLPEPTICCNTGNLGHVGVFRIKARVYASIGSGGAAQNIHVRFSWQDGEGPLRGNSWQSLNLGGTFVEVDLGIVTVNPAIAGAQKWLGQIEAYSDNAATADTLHVDEMTILPVLEGYGKALGAQPLAMSPVLAFDNFTTGTLSGSLNGRTPAIGAAWATSGATTDFTVNAGFAERQTVSDSQPRYAVLGSAMAGMKVTLNAQSVNPANVSQGVIARWVNSSNYAFLHWLDETGILELGVVLEGTAHVLATHVALAGPTLRMELSATPDGALSGSIWEGSTLRTLAASHASLGSGGVLETGKGGLKDRTASALLISRLYNSLTIRSLPGVPYCIKPSQPMQFRSDSTIAMDSTGTYYGPVPEYRGSRFYVPQAGEANRTSRIIVKADRNDLEESDQQVIADAFTAQVYYTPRYSVIPR